MVLDAFSRHTDGFPSCFMAFAMVFDSISYCVFGLCGFASDGIVFGFDSALILVKNVFYTEESCFLKKQKDGCVWGQPSF